MQINHTIASVRRTRLTEEPEPIDEEDDDGTKTRLSSSLMLD